MEREAREVQRRLTFTPAARALAEAEWTERLHPRNRLGMWIDRLGDAISKPTRLGVTPYLQRRSAERGQPVPKSHAEAAGLHKDPAWAPLFDEFEVTAEALADKHGIKLERGERNVGVFEGVFEPSYTLKVKGDKDKIDEFAKELGGDFEQKAVVGFTVGEGEDVELRMPVGDDPDAFYRELVEIMGEGEAGITYGGDEWRIFIGAYLDDFEGISERVAALAVEHGMQPQAFVGTGDFHQLREGTG